MIWVYELLQWVQKSSLAGGGLPMTWLPKTWALIGPRMYRVRFMFESHTHSIRKSISCFMWIKYWVYASSLSSSLIFFWSLSTMQSSSGGGGWWVTHKSSHATEFSLTIHLRKVQSRKTNFEFLRCDLKSSQIKKYISHWDLILQQEVEYIIGRVWLQGSGRK